MISTKSPQHATGCRRLCRCCFSRRRRRLCVKVGQQRRQLRQLPESYYHSYRSPVHSCFASIYCNAPPPPQPPQRLPWRAQATPTANLCSCPRAWAAAALAQQLSVEADRRAAEETNGEYCCRREATRVTSSAGVGACASLAHLSQVCPMKKKNQHRTTIATTKVLCPLRRQTFLSPQSTLGRRCSNNNNEANNKAQLKCHTKHVSSPVHQRKHSLSLSVSLH